MSNNLSRRRFLRYSTLLMGALAVGGISPMNSAQAAAIPAQGANILIVYYSRTGNTATVAKYIQASVGGDLVALETVQPYPEAYRATTEQAKRELQSGYLPPLKTQISNIEAYTRIFVGSPNWWSTIAPPVMTFLSSYDMAGKILMPFMTHGGSGLARSVADIKKLCPKATVTEGLAIRGEKVVTAKPEVSKWLSSLGMAAPV